MSRVCILKVYNYRLKAKWEQYGDSFVHVGLLYDANRLSAEVKHRFEHLSLNGTALLVLKFASAAQAKIYRMMLLAAAVCEQRATVNVLGNATNGHLLVRMTTAQKQTLKMKKCSCSVVLMASVRDSAILTSLDSSSKRVDRIELL